MLGSFLPESHALMALCETQIARDNLLCVISHSFIYCFKFSANKIFIFHLYCVSLNFDNRFAVLFFNSGIDFPFFIMILRFISQTSGTNLPFFYGYTTSCFSNFGNSSFFLRFPPLKNERRIFLVGYSKQFLFFYIIYPRRYF